MDEVYIPRIFGPSNVLKVSNVLFKETKLSRKIITIIM